MNIQSTLPNSNSLGDRKHARSNYRDSDYRGSFARSFSKDFKFCSKQQKFELHEFELDS